MDDLSEIKPEKSGIIRDKEGKFIPGISGNPTGKPEGTLSLVSLLKEELKKFVKEKGKKKGKTKAKLLIDKILKKAIDEEDVPMIKDILNRIDGMPRQPIGLENEGELPFFIKIIKQDAGNTNATEGTGSEDVPKTI